MDVQFLSRTGSDGCRTEVKKLPSENDITVYKVSMKFSGKISPEPVTLRFSAPVCGCFSQWSPLRNFERSLLPDWGEFIPETPSRLAFGMPLHCFISQSGKNKICTAVSDLKTPLTMRTGVNDDGTIHYEFVFFCEKIAPISEYTALIRFDMRCIFYGKAAADGVKWLEEYNGIIPAPVPENAAMPVYSTWYSYHQQLKDEDIISECKKAYSLGMRTVIIDDGWQTESCEGGYEYCGEWQPCESKIKDMAKLVDAVHSCGMKVMLWYSVPFVGKKTCLWKRFEGKYLDDPKNNWNCLDPRFPDVREYIAETYENALKAWKLDGFKLDFIDEFCLTDFSDTSSSERDYDSVEDALERLLHDIYMRLSKIKPDVLIEFRQRYIGPAVRTCGNMIRVGDCAYDMLRNRMGAGDLRLTSGKTPVHSDMLIWNYKDSTEDAAKQLINVLFAVPQISVRLGEIPEAHGKMLKFYLDFWIKHRDTLLFGDFYAHCPESLYSLVEVKKDGTHICVCFGKNTVKISEPQTFIINGSGDEYVILLAERDTEISYAITSCTGEPLGEGTIHAGPRGRLLKLEQSAVAEIHII